MLAVGASAWAATLETFLGCGRNRAECVVYWVSRQTDPDVVVQVIHPDHTSGAWMYEIADGWLGAFMVRLHEQRCTVRAQVHTHCDQAFHSETDDRWPLVTTPGFLSLVLPRFGRPPIVRSELFLAELDATGEWRAVDVAHRIVGIP